MDSTYLQTVQIYKVDTSTFITVILMCLFEVENVCLTTTDYAHWFKTACG